MRLDQKYKTLFAKNGINTPLRVAYFMSVLDHESGLKPIRESLYFTTIQGLRDNFKTPFKNKTDTFVAQYLKNSVKCANYVYANREGNGNEKSGDGYKYRGGGFIQNTFKKGYKLLSEKTDVDFVNNPNLILEEANAMLAACLFWKENNINKYADINDLDGVSDLVNIGKKTIAIGDSNNYKHRKECLEKWKKILNIK